MTGVMTLGRHDRLAAIPKVGGGPDGSDRRSQIDRDYGRVIHSGAFRRLQAKSQVVHTGQADFFRTRLTHSLEVAQIARDLARRLPVDDGSTGGEGNGPALVEVAALIHDLGHPPFGHNGEDALKDWMTRMDSSFEANAQSLRIVARLEVKYDSPHETALGTKERVGLNLTMETLAASLKYPWAQHRGRQPRGAKPRRDATKFGYYPEEAQLAELAIRSVLPEAPDALTRKRRHAAAEIVDWADDVAFSVHDLEDGIRAGLVPLDWLLRREAAPDRTAIVRMAADHLRKDAWPGEVKLTRSDLVDAMEWLKGYRRLVPLKRPYARQDRQRGYVKEMTTSLIDQLASGLTAAKAGPLRTGEDLIRSRETEARMAILKAVNWRYVINSRAVQTMQFRERRIVAALCEALLLDGAVLLPEERRDDYSEALREDATASGGRTSKAGIKDFLTQERVRLAAWDVLPEAERAKAGKARRARIVCDYVAGMTDSFAERSYERLAGFEPQSVSDFV